MGVKISHLIKKDEISLGQLSGKVIVIDSFIYLYQFLSTIRQADGSPLKDSQGRVTSHLSGLFFRTVKLLEKGLKLVFVFDGDVPVLKQKERDRRSAEKEKAQKQYEIAEQYGDLEAMKKYASRTVKLTAEIISESKELITALGQPIVQAPSEGEAQASHIVKKGDGYAVSTQDADALLFGCPKIIRNLSILGKKKKAAKLAYETIKPEMILLSDTLNEMGVDQDQLIALSMLVGTDYNIGGIKGIGPQKAMKLVKQYGSDFKALFDSVEWSKSFDVDWQIIFDAIKNVAVTDDYTLSWNDVDKEKVFQLLVEKHNFSQERVESSVNKLLLAKEKSAQKGLMLFFER